MAALGLSQQALAPLFERLHAACSVAGYRLRLRQLDPGAAFDDAWVFERMDLLLLGEGVDGRRVAASLERSRLAGRGALAGGRIVTVARDTDLPRSTVEDALRGAIQGELTVDRGSMQCRNGRARITVTGRTG